jgi:plasmid stabilization system protein ParE
VQKKYKVSITKTAQQDFVTIWEYISADNPLNARTFLDEIEAKALSLQLLPQRHQMINENELLGTDYRHLVYKKYRIIYRIDVETVYILRIIHGAKPLD